MTLGRFILKILAIDTSGLQAGAAIVCGDNSSYITIGEITLNARTGSKSFTHSEILMPAIEQLFLLTRLEARDVDYIAYTNGPGSFTGLRIGASSALALGYALNKPTIAVPTLDALAYNMINAGEEANIIPMLDARRGQIYTAIYKRNGEGKITRTTDFLALEASTFLKNQSSLKNTCVITLGDGADENYNVIKEFLPNANFAKLNNNRQRASSVGAWAIEKISEGLLPSENVEILYVREPQAVREREKKCIR